MTPETIIFSHPAPRASNTRIMPVFLTQAGCGERCLFCAQDKQSGTPRQHLQRSLDQLREMLAEKTGHTPFELAFYGGTFTALPDDYAFRFLEAAAPYAAAGLVTGVRCSTRPDAAAPELLARLAQAGLTTVELGVQTFEDQPLHLARRGHDGQACRDACTAVARAGLGLGVQLLPGLPGHDPDGLSRDIAECLRLRPDFVRLHPCLALAGTGLEALWRGGAWTPWSMDACLEALSRAVLSLWRAGISVARIGLAPEPSLVYAVVAGPWHPALGMRVRALALHAHIAGLLSRAKAVGLAAPQRISGEFWGHKRELEPAYLALGLSKAAVRFHHEDYFQLDVAYD